MTAPHSPEARPDDPRRRTPAAPPGLPRSLREEPRLIGFLGIISLGLGLVALVFPLLAALTTELLIGAILVTAGLVSVVHALRLRGEEGWGLDLLVGAVALLVGVVLLAFPAAGLLSLSLLMVAFFLAQGVLRLVAALRCRGRPAWGWLLAAAMLELGLGLVVLAGFPGTAIWVLGVLLGIELVFDGVALLVYAMAVRRSLAIVPSAPLSR